MTGFDPSSIIPPAQDWAADAACAEVGGDFWHPDRGEPTAPGKRICARCPVRVECLQHALDNDEQHGTWGGMSEGERRLLIRRRRAEGDSAAVVAA
ncbi:WhiB family transcriptional regulator [Pseudonocardia sp. NPDC049635]|uniref:WhiB family transcriptional regulator n=1 Tax=Pseudonocardia sp. NPDC049635 TaxID=3155506 RepID=UPI0033E11E6C